MCQLAHVNSKLVGLRTLYEGETQKVKNERNDQMNLVIE